MFLSSTEEDYSRTVHVFSESLRWEQKAYMMSERAYHAASTIDLAVLDLDKKNKIRPAQMFCRSDMKENIQMNNEQ